MRQVYENIEILRTAKGITKRALASMVGISEMACNRYLWGESKLPADIVTKFAEGLGISDINILFNEKLTDSVIGSLKN